MAYARVKLCYGPYVTRLDVACEPDDDDDRVIARAWSIARQRGWLTLPMAYQSARVEHRSDA